MEAKSKPKQSFFRRYYYAYLDSFVEFLVPSNARTSTISGFEGLKKKQTVFAQKDFDYIVAIDALGYASDVEGFLSDAYKSLKGDGRVVITQYSALWEPVLRVASMFGLRRGAIEQNWLSVEDIKNFGTLAGFETIRAGSKMLVPLYIPLVSAFFNKFVANIWPFTRFGMFHYVVMRKAPLALQSKPSLTIVVPARNEAGTIKKIISELPELGSFTEIILIEGNSTDDTYAAIEKEVKAYRGRNKIKYAKQTGKGKGDAVRLGFEMAEGDILSIYDADMTVPPEEMEKFYNAIASGKGDFINGCRLVYPMQKESMRILNIFGNKFFSFAFSAILGERIKDTLCGTKVLWKKDYEKIKKGRKFFGDFDPFGDFDLLFGAAKLNLKIIDLPVHYRERTYGTTNISRFRHGWLLLKMTVFAARKMKFR
jgi:hypothetical protein